ncbi:MAG: LD-carboxypeptidase [Candidatus Eremiobacteraeota bacterium]|nr:LD-carboxypeptidase [Candidatus Eremiobacteraeota bacterium]
MPLVKPPRLRRGDRVAVVSQSWGGPGAHPARYALGRRALEETFGLEVVEMPHALADPEWLARNPQARAADLETAFADPAVRAVIASIGGEDSVRVLPHLDIGAIARNPKIFLGYSDATSIHLACFKAGLSSFYGPTVMAGFAENGGMFDYCADSVRRTLFSTEPVGTIAPNRGGWTAEFLDWADPSLNDRTRALNPSTGPRVLQGHGVARGPLLGGCADVLEMLKGTPWWPPLEAWRGAILFYETSEDAPGPASVLRWLRNFAAQGILQVLAGMLFGRPGGDMPPERHADYDAAVVHALDEAGLVDLPVLAGLDFGHTDPIFTLPYGAVAEIDCGAATLTIAESGVV